MDPDPPAHGGPDPRASAAIDVVEGTVSEWERCADMAFPVTGDYVVPEALNLVHMDRERDHGVYVEENLWVEHPI